VESSVQIPLPILAIAALKSPSINPLDLIIAVENAANDFNDAHKDNDDFKFDDATIGAKKLPSGFMPSIWASSVRQGFLLIPTMKNSPSMPKNVIMHASSPPSTRGL
jgi:hypothetical protein